MARILPRLLAQLQRQPLVQDFSKFTLPRRRPRSLYRPVPPPPSFKPSDHDTRSILLHHPPTNPITRSRLHLRHKSLPPLPRRFTSRRNNEKDSSRPMTTEERQFWSSPYLRMLASPLRQCVTTFRFLPTDFLVRLAINRIPATHYPKAWKRPEAPQTFIPDGLQHTKFTARRSGKAHYTLCSRHAINHLSDPSTKRRAAHSVQAHPFLADHVAHLLRLRVLQELELLADHLDASNSKSKSKPRLLRRLTLSEWRIIVETGTIPHPGALAVLVVPPLQKDRITRLRPMPNMSAAPPPPDTLPPPKNPVVTPPCVLYPVRDAQWGRDVGEGVLPEERVPLYSGPVLFPERGQRAALHALLLRLLTIEHNSGRVHVHTKEGGKAEKQDDNDKSKPSHAFLLSSDAETVLRGDTAAVAIALWRLRMFEDPGEDMTSESAATGWEWTRRQKRM
ncbi:hypothetical protein C0991_005932 [Blastosporella zonata]|nr:hypothetical protein C0991_005932 [Blastosporella zonata]